MAVADRWQEHIISHDTDSLDHPVVRDIAFVYDHKDPNAFRRCENLVEILKRFIKIRTGDGFRSPYIYTQYQDIREGFTAFDKLQDIWDKTVYVFIVLTVGLGKDQNSYRTIEEIISSSMQSRDQSDSVVLILAMTRGEIKESNYKLPFGLKSYKPIDVSHIVKGKKLTDVNGRDLTSRDLREDVLEKLQVILQRCEPKRVYKERLVDAHCNRPSYQRNTPLSQGSNTEQEDTFPFHSLPSGVTSNGGPVSSPSDEPEDLSTLSSSRVETAPRTEPNRENALSEGPASNSTTLSRELRTSQGKPVKTNMDTDTKVQEDVSLSIDDIDENIAPDDGFNGGSSLSGATTVRNKTYHASIPLELHLREDVLAELDQSGSSTSAESSSSSSQSTGLTSFLSSDSNYMLSDEVMAMASLTKAGISSFISSFRRK